MDYLEGITSRYTGEAQIQRLLKVAEKAPEDIATEARRLAVLEAQNQSNFVRLTEFGITDLPSNTSDERQVLLNRLQAAQAHLNKDAIRAAYLSLAAWDLQHGQRTDAWYSLLRAKDYGATRAQTTECCLRLLECAMLLPNVAAVQEYATKLQHWSHPVAIAKGWEKMMHGNYEQALQVWYDFWMEGSDDPLSETILSTPEVGRYTAWLALAVGSRSQIQRLAEHASMDPQWRDVLRAFGRAQYQQAWASLESLRHHLDWDVYACTQATTVWKKIRDNVYLQAWKPYGRLPLVDLQQELGPVLCPSFESLVQVWVGLLEHLPDSRLDRTTNTLEREMASEEEAKMESTRSALEEASGQVVVDTYTMMVRMTCQEHNISVSDPKNSRSARVAEEAMANVNEAAPVAAIEDDDDDDVPMVDAENPEDLY